MTDILSVVDISNMRSNFIFQKEKIKRNHIRKYLN